MSKAVRNHLLRGQGGPLPALPTRRAHGETEVPETCDVLVIGAGIIGLAVARAFLARNPGTRLTVLEREREVGLHQTSHNSGVIHAGVYYEPGSLKARLCVEGARLLFAFCEARGIDVEHCGKLVVARTNRELPRLDELERRARANGVAIRRLATPELHELEPEVTGVAALHSPMTGIVDYGTVARALCDEVEERGGTVTTGCAVERVREDPRGPVVLHERGRTRAAAVVACAGLWSDRLAVRSGADPNPRITPFRGAYFRLRRPELIRGLVYPVPDPRLPFLGVHLTRRVGGDVIVGPTALLVGARDAYSLRRLRLRDMVDTITWPGTYRLVRRWWRHGLTEIRHATSRAAYTREVQCLVPAVTREDLVPGFAGVRAQALDRSGRLVDDFVFTASGRVLHVRNAPSPGATSSLAIAEEIAARAERLER